MEINSMLQQRLGINIDHVATIRNVRDSFFPDPFRAAQIVEQSCADGLTLHLREDRRHIRDEDVARICAESKIPVNLETAATDEMLEIVLRNRPNAACIVPEKREELTTEGGLDVVGGREHIASVVQSLSHANIRVSLFVEPDIEQISAAHAMGAPVVELHTGTYCDAYAQGNDQKVTYELDRIQKAVEFGKVKGMELHAGHGLTYDNVSPIAAISGIFELNIGHFLIGESIFLGLEGAILKMRQIMDKAAAH